MAIEIRDVAYHRNGIAGLPFYAVLFNDTDAGMFNQVATIDEDGKDCRVINAGMVVTAGEIGTRHMNKWRGDRYLHEIKEAMREHRHNEYWDWYTSIFEQDTRPQCSECGYAWSACLGDDEVPTKCKCGGEVILP